MAEGTKTYNHDVAGLWRRFNRFIQELAFSQSNPSSQVKAFDQERMRSYIDAIISYTDWVVAQPELDLPETHPRLIELAPPENYSVPENESLMDAITMLEVCRDELVNGQSSRNASGLNKFDNERLRAVMEKMSNFLDNYIAEVTPLDLPESSPMRVMTGPGKKGV